MNNEKTEKNYGEADISCDVSPDTQFIVSQSEVHEEKGCVKVLKYIKNKMYLYVDKNKKENQKCINDFLENIESLSLKQRVILHECISKRNIDNIASMRKDLGQDVLYIFYKLFKLVLKNPNLTVAKFESFITKEQKLVLKKILNSFKGVPNEEVKDIFIQKVILNFKKMQLNEQKNLLRFITEYKGVIEKQFEKNVKELDSLISLRTKGQIMADILLLVIATTAIIIGISLLGILPIISTPQIILPIISKTLGVASIALGGISLWELTNRMNFIIDAKHKTHEQHANDKACDFIEKIKQIRISNNNQCLRI